MTEQEAAIARNREHGPVNLCKTLAMIADAKGDISEVSDPDGFIAAALQDAEDMVAELWPAREVVSQARLQSRPHAYLRRAIAAYDKEVRP